MVLGSRPPELEALIERRRLADADHHDEVWEGVLHMSPPPSHEHQSIAQQLAVLLDSLARSAGLEPLIQEFAVGESEQNYRVPDGGLHRPGASGVWHSTAALVIEIVSPGDQSWAKLPFYAEHGVDEVLIVDPAKRTVSWLALEEGEYRPIERSGLIELGPTTLAEQLNWP
ncbi:MAG: hypothetical protein DLM64_10935 [Solirubrobacterales bacterium]|nr:MAG: hypothetical protein DLM64_10935 [Solirubrobacterales bacterium]